MLLLSCVASERVNKQQIMCSDSSQQAQQSTDLHPITDNKTHTGTQQIPHETNDYGNVIRKMLIHVKQNTFGGFLTVIIPRFMPPV